MIELEKIKLQNTIIQRNNSNNQYSKNFQELLQEKTPTIKTSEQISSSKPIDYLPIEHNFEYRQELSKRSKEVLKTLDLLRLKMLEGIKLTDVVCALAQKVAELEEFKFDEDETFDDLILRAKVEITKYQETE
jgi:hypothetical protein